MDLWDFDGCHQVNLEDDLLKRLQSMRRGLDGAFILSHDGDEAL